MDRPVATDEGRQPGSPAATETEGENDLDWVSVNPSLFCLCRGDSLVLANETYLMLIGVTDSETVLGTSFSGFLEDGADAVVRCLTGTTADERTDLRATLVSGRGERILLDLTIRPLVVAGERLSIIEGGEAGRADSPAEDFSAVEGMEDGGLSTPDAPMLHLDEKIRLLDQVFRYGQEGMFLCDGSFKILAANDSLAQVTGIGRGDLIGRELVSLTFVRNEPARYEELLLGLERQGRWIGDYEAVRHGNQPYRERLALFVTRSEGGKPVTLAGMVADVTPKSEETDTAYREANFDSITGLPNRIPFLDRLKHDTAARERSGKSLALMFIDLDGFKLVNDSAGHEVGDMLRREVAQRISACVRKGDTVARLGGDEFTILMPDLSAPMDAQFVAQRVQQVFSTAFTLQQQEYLVSCSIGISICPDDAEDSMDLLRNADTAMYRAKEKGKATYQFFTSDINEDATERLHLKAGLAKALEQGEFVMHYQPKVALSTPRITGVEALMRWFHGDMGLISPAKFIPLLEETGQIIEAGEWAIRAACRQHVDWLAAGLPRIPVAVNLSARQLREASFVRTVTEVLEETGVDPTALEFEITESMLMADTDSVVGVLETLHQLGIRISMDDFGTGYSSLSYLKRFPIDTIKIDRSFVADIVENPDDAAIIRTIISMGHTLERKVVAEGVETEEQLAMLRRFGCDEMQGYYFSPPMAPEKLTDFMREKAKL